MWLLKIKDYLRGDINEFVKRVRALCRELKVLEIKQITWKGNMHVINTHIYTRVRVKVTCKPSTMNRSS